MGRPFSMNTTKFSVSLSTNPRVRRKNRRIRELTASQGVESRKPRKRRGWERALR
jgi:hypothetical protein